MIVHFAASNSAIAIAIRTLTLSKWSHCAIQIGPSIFEVTMRDGVSVTSMQEFRRRYPKSTTAIVDGGNKDIATTWLRAQVGKEYDYTALIGLPIDRDWQDPDKWFCSEYVAEALIKCGVMRPKVKSSRITPKDLYLLLTCKDIMK